MANRPAGHRRAGVRRTPRGVIDPCSERRGCDGPRYGDPRGHPRVREVLAAYLARVRGIRTAPALMLVTNGFSSGLASGVVTLREQGVDRIAVEDPGGTEARRRVAAAGAEIVPVPWTTRAWSSRSWNDLALGRCS
jgi:DNA-binding transcriptional MocR family regulator